VGQGWVGPSEFWRMHPQEVWWLVEAKMPRQSGLGSDLEDVRAFMQREGLLDG